MFRKLLLALFGVVALVGVVMAQSTSFNWPTPAGWLSGVGDIPYAASTNSLNSIAAVPTGQVLISAGVETVPAWSATPALTSITLSSGTAVTKMTEYSATLTWVTSGTGMLLIGANACQERNVAVSGVALGDLLFANSATISGEVAAMVGIRPSTVAGNVMITFCNPSGTGDTPPGGVYTIFAIST